MSEYSKEFEKYKEFVNKHFRYDYAMFDLPKDAKMLEIGCGFGDRMEILQNMGYKNILGIDIDEYMIEQAKEKKLNVALGSIENTGLESAQFDVVLVENVFHHIELYEQALDELHRVLKPDGVLCFIEPRFSIFRYILDFVTFKTPAPKLLKGPWAMRYNVMGQEIASGMYPLWRKSQQRFFRHLNKKYNIVFNKSNMWFHFVKALKVN